MKKLYDGKCDNSGCDLAGERAEFYAEGVDKDGKLVDAMCEECGGRVAHALSPIRIGRHGGGHGECAGIVARLGDVRDGKIGLKLGIVGSHHAGCEVAEMVDSVSSGRAVVDQERSTLLLGADAEPVALRLVVKSVDKSADKPTLH